jgi:CRP/FNR family transcriptional regulator
MANHSWSSAADAPHPVVNLAALKTACSSCNLRELCMPVGLSPQQLESLDELVYARKTVRRGESLFRAGDAFRSLYAIRSGFFKTRIAGSDGLDQIAGFHMTGEMLGIDGVGTDRHACDAVALEDSELCVIPYAALGDLSRRLEPLHRHFHKVMGREIVRDHGAMLMLGSMRANEKLAVFLLDLSQRFAARGFSPSEFMLRMTRGEIASFLGLKLETVSRLFSKFRDDGLLEVRQKHVRIRDIRGLQELTDN